MANIMKIINFGSLNIDKVCSVEEFVQPGETIMATGYSVNAGGKGLNQSVAAARAGAQVLHAGAVGSDGLFLKEILADAGADVSCLRVMDTESGCAFIEVNSKGQNRIIVSAGTNRMYTEEYIKNVLEKKPEILCFCRMRSIWLGKLSDSVMKKAAELFLMHRRFPESRRNFLWNWWISLW